MSFASYLISADELYQHPPIHLFVTLGLILTREKRNSKHGHNYEDTFIIKTAKVKIFQFTYTHICAHSLSNFIVNEVTPTPIKQHIFLSCSKTTLWHTKTNKYWRWAQLRRCYKNALRRFRSSTVLNQTCL